MPGYRLAMCGEMAGDPLYAAILLGMGFQHLSMNVASIPWVKKVVRSVRMQDAVELASLVMQQPTAAQAQKNRRAFHGGAVPGAGCGTVIGAQAGKQLSHTEAKIQYEME